MAEYVMKITVTGEGDDIHISVDSNTGAGDDKASIVAGHLLKILAIAVDKVGAAAQQYVVMNGEETIN